MNRMLVVVPVYGGWHESKPYWGTLVSSIRGDRTDILIIDNGASIDEGQVDFINRFVRPAFRNELIYQPFDDNLGLVKSLQWAYENTQHDILAYIHNDLYIYEPGWDHKVLHGFNGGLDNPGLVGFFGAEGIHPSSGRYNVWNNMLEAEIHGWRFKDGFKEVAVLDGLCMIASRKMLDVRRGVDTSFSVHHFYDLDLSLESIDRGFKNYVLPVYCHHQSGQTACRPLFQEWANKFVGVPGGEQILYQNNLMLWKKKWEQRLPWQVGFPWTSAIR